jgi:hypothetical protein
MQSQLACSSPTHFACACALPRSNPARSSGVDKCWPGGDKSPWAVAPATSTSNLRTLSASSPPTLSVSAFSVAQASCMTCTGVRNGDTSSIRKLAAVRAKWGAGFHFAGKSHPVDAPARRARGSAATAQLRASNAQCGRRCGSGVPVVARKLDSPTPARSARPRERSSETGARRIELARASQSVLVAPHGDRLEAARGTELESSNVR